ncbi:autotransporter adhesin BigA [Enterobacter sichuanensis]|uniref:BigA/YdbA N-terminal beta-barrel domain-containing protein n=1 Tax=Enterobacter sichuanensis TaxID=2071710 RepID=UPI002FD6D967
MENRKKVLAVCIALALSSKVYAEELSDTRKSCPQNTSSLTKSQKDKLPDECKSEQWGWAAGGIAALLTGVAVGVHNSGGDGDHTSSTPADNDNDNGDHTPPTPPDDGNDDGDHTPPTPPDDNNDDGTDDGGDVTPPDTSVTTYNNGVTLDRGAKTVTFDTVTLNGESWQNVTFSYVQDGNNYILTAPDGRTLIINQKYVTSDNNAVMAGTQSGTGYVWKYDSQGRFWFATADSAIIEGDGQTNTLDNSTSASGANSIGTLISGDKTENSLNGDITAGESAIGVVISGDETNTTINGNIYASGGATGLFVSGNDASVTNKGSITAVDTGSVGVAIAGNHATFSNVGNIDSSLNGTGVSITGDDATVRLDGAVNVHVEQNKDGIYQSATGVSITGNRSDTTITGNITLTNTDTTNSATGSLTGLAVTGDNNNVTLDGTLALNLTSSKQGTFGAQGIAVSGTGNHVQLKNGVVINATLLNGADPSLSTVSITGDNTVSVSGHSTLSTNGGPSQAPVSLANVKGGGTLILNSDSVLDINIKTDPLYYDAFSSLDASGSGSTIDNKGIINATGFPTTMSARNGAVVSNSGTINAAPSSDEFRSGLLTANGAASMALNRAGGEINILSTSKPFSPSGAAIFPLVWYGNTAYALLAYNGGAVENQADATITLQGAGLYGVAASMGTARNAGTINIDGFLPVLDDNGKVTNKTFVTPAGNKLYTMGAGVIAGSTDSGKGNATGINTGTINVNNEGFGMLALDGGTVTNQGTINLTADADVGKSVDNQLIGMGVMSGGLAINDQTGVININADYGKAFYNDGTGFIVNYGTICTNGNCQDSDTYNPTDNLVSLEYHAGLLSEKDQTVTLSKDAVITGAVGNDGTVNGSNINVAGASAILNNSATGVINASVNLKSVTDTASSNQGVIDKVTFGAAAVFNNSGTVNDLAMTSGATANNLSGGVISVPTEMWKGTLNNWGEVDGTMDIASSAFTFYNAGTFNGKVKTASAKGGMVVNDGVINTSGNNTVAMSASGSATMVNNGTLNLGTRGTTDTGMVGMQLESNATSSAVVENNGTINIYANNSWAFSQLGNDGHIVNNGTVYIDDGVTGSGLIKQSDKTIEGSGEGGNGTETHYVDFTTPVAPGSDSSSTVKNSLAGYVVGTNADGSAGKLMVNNASLNGVGINTGFTSGTAATTVTFDNVVQGSNLSDAGNITSTSVVWNAQGSTDASGNVDVTMTKNAYADVTTDSAVSNVASALDAGYTNNELYTSLNVSTTAELNSALKQISGSQANSAFNQARMLSNRFDMLADTAPVLGNGLAMNLVAKDDPRAELGKKTRYDMLALRQKLELTDNQSLSLEYGIARVEGNNSSLAGDNNVTGGYSQFFGLKHEMAFDHGLSWNNDLRYDVHTLDSNRAVSYGSVSKSADSSLRQQYLELRSSGAKQFALSEGLTVTPYAGVKLRHTLEDGYIERNAGDFNLKMNSGSETAVDGIAGLKLNYAGKNGWETMATLEGGPNLSYAKSQRSASLQGAGGQQFNVDDGQKGGGMNSLATVGVKYSGKESAMNLEAFHWKEDGISDKGLMMKYNLSF